ncbi:MAG: glycosyltransferase family 4 protein [Rhizomicrobium sp.]
MRVLFLTDNFVPERNAPALRSYEHCRRWARQGVDVTVITTVPNFPLGKPQPPYRNTFCQHEEIDGIRVIRVWSFLAPNRGVVLRALDFASFAVSGFLAGLFERPDIIVATSPQMLTAVAGHLLGRVKRRPWVFEVRDLWPESITAVGAMKDGFVIRFLGRVERMLYDGAERIVTVTEPIRRQLVARGIPPEKIAVVTNGADLERLVPRIGNPQLKSRLKLEGKFIVAYVGTHGFAQGLEVVVRAAAILRDSDVHFLFVGEGARRDDLIAFAGELGVSNVSFVGSVASEAAVDYLALADAIVVPLKNSAVFEGALPSKIFEAAAMEKPILLSANGASAELVRDYRAGIVVPPENPEALAGAAQCLRSNAVLRESFRDGCKRLARHHDRERLAGVMLAEIRRAHESAANVS